MSQTESEHRNDADDAGRQAHVAALLDTEPMDQDQVRIEVVTVPDPSLPVKFEKNDSRVKYREATNPEVTCDQCVFFKFNGDEGMYGCAVVEGRIRKKDVCNLHMSIDEEYTEARDDSGESDEKTEMTELYMIGAQDQDERLLALFTEIPQTDESIPETIPLLPRPGMYKHPRYGDIVITRQRNENFVRNINDQVYQQYIPIDAEHQTKLSGAFGFIVGAQLNEDGSADAQVQWNKRGVQVITDRRFRYISPEWLLRYQDPATGDIHEDVVVAAALTNNPFFKEPALRPLIANERGVWDVRHASDDDGADIIILQMCDGASDDHIEHDERSLEMGEPQHTPDVVEEQDDEQLRQATEDPVAEQEQVIESEPETEDVPSESDEEVTMTATEKIVSPEVIVQLPEDVQHAFTEMQTMVKETQQLAESERQVAQQYRERLEEADRRIKAMEDKARRERYIAMVRGRDGENDGAQWFGEPDKHVSMLESLAEAFGEDSEQFKNYVDIQRANAAQVHQSDLMREVGTQIQGASDAWRQIEAKAEEYRQQYSDKNMTLQQAIAAVTERYPELHEQYKAERGMY